MRGKTNKKRAPVCCFTPHLSTSLGKAMSHSQQPGLQLGSPMLVARACSVLSLRICVSQARLGNQSRCSGSGCRYPSWRCTTVPDAQCRTLDYHGCCHVPRGKKVKTFLGWKEINFLLYLIPRICGAIEIGT